MAKRHRDALAIQMGACNPSGIAHSIVEACEQIRAERAGAGIGTVAITSDAAIRLMVHQLAFICNVAEIDNTLDTYGELTRFCESEAGNFRPPSEEQCPSN